MLWFSIISFILCMGIFHIYPYFREKSKLLSYVEKDEYFYIIVFFLIKEKAYKKIYLNGIKCIMIHISFQKHLIGMIQNKVINIGLI